MMGMRHLKNDSDQKLFLYFLYLLGVFVIALFIINNIPVDHNKYPMFMFFEEQMFIFFKVPALILAVAVPVLVFLKTTNMLLHWLVSRKEALDDTE